MKGARYEFTSSYSGSGVLQLQADSPLYQALCGSSGVAWPSGRKDVDNAIGTRLDMNGCGSSF